MKQHHRLTSGRCSWKAWGLGCLLALQAAQAQEITITEVMWHPVGTNLSEQWFEIKNLASTTTNLSGWRVAGDVDLTLPTNTIVSAGGYLVVAADEAIFHSNHAGVSPVVGGWTGVLKNHLKLLDTTGATVESLDFHSEGDWAVRRLAPPHFGHQGWEWYAPHQGLGSTLERVNESLPGSLALNWASSSTVGGTPGHPNSVATTNAPPILTEVAHQPIIPTPSDPVAIRVRVTDEHTDGLSVTLQWRVDGTTPFNTTPMADDGKHADGTASDGLWGAMIPPQSNGTVVEFFLKAKDAEGQERIYPAFLPPGNGRTANLLYQVDAETYTGSQPLYRIIMREVERAELRQLGRQFPEADSDAQMNATWITTDGVLDGGTTTQLRYNTGVRNRGHGTRTSNPNNYHVNVPDDRPWKSQGGINLNSGYSYSQVLGSAIFRVLEVPMADSRLAQVRINSTNLMAVYGSTSFGSYAANEQYNNDFVQRSWPLDPTGNSYRGIRGPTASSLQTPADLTWHGPDFFASASYTNCYFKQNNFLENDYSDLIDLLAVLNSTNGHAAADYEADVRQRIDVDQWMRYMAINTLLANTETCLANGVGDDFSLYRGTNNTRFVLLPYDLDSILGRGLTPTPPTNGLWLMTAIPAMDRFMRHPAFAPIYLKQLLSLARTGFAPERMNVFIDQVLANDVPSPVRETFKTFNSNQVNHVIGLIPQTLDVAHGLTTNQGYPYTTADSISLLGNAPAIPTREVRVNGAPSTYSGWEGRWTNSAVHLHPGINRILVQALDQSGAETASTFVDIWRGGTTAQTVGGTLSGNTTWAAAAGPFLVSSSLTVAPGATLTIEAGTSVYLASGVNLSVAIGGALHAVGTPEAPIRFTRPPGTTTNWGNLAINGTVGSPDSHISYVLFEFNGGADGTPCIDLNGGGAVLDHLSFGSTTRPYLHVDGASFIVRDCIFPSPTLGFEPIHGTRGVRSDGQGLFARNFFGRTMGYNDVIDFTGGNRPGGPIVQFINNVFTGASDDMLDLDGTDGWVEGNIFLHCHKNGSPDSSSAVSGGDDSGHTSEVTIVGNLFYDCDQAVTAKQGNSYTVIHNTIVRQTRQGGLDTDAGVVNVADDKTTQGFGVYLEGNVIVDAEKLLRNQTNAVVVFTNNLLPLPWTGPGGNNSTNAPLLNYIPRLDETYFSSFEAAQVIREWFRPGPGSPAIGLGLGGRDLGATGASGPVISGEPSGTNRLNSATLTVGWNRTGPGISPAGFPNGSGYVAYRYQLDEGPWSPEQPIGSPITLTGLSEGPHHVKVTGKTDIGLYRDDPIYGLDALTSTSKVWVVDANYVPPIRPSVVINEVLARNNNTLTNAGTTPDLIELHNPGPGPVNLSGFGLTDTVTQPYKFTFPPGTSLAPGTYLVVAADAGSGGALLHTGFTLRQEGDDVSLFDAAANGGALIDSIRFGLQLSDQSIGRRSDGSWGLCRPTFGTANIALATGDIFALRINEWLADAQFTAKNDFVELYNPGDLPVDLGGLFWSDSAGAPGRHQVPLLSYMPAASCLAFIADANPGQGADHLSFRLSPEVGLILLSAPDLAPIDAIAYGAQRTDVAQGRSPNGTEQVVDFTVPTPGGANPGAAAGGCRLATISVPLLPMNATWRYNQSANLDGQQWYTSGYIDSTWPQGPALLAREDCGCLPVPIATPLTLGRSTYYFRTRFLVDTNLAGFKLNLTTVMDDSAVVYLNGTRILTNGLASGTPAYADFANRNVDNASFEYFSVDASALIQGENTLAVEVHQTSSTSSDVVWGMSMEASLTYTNCTPVDSPPIVLNELMADNRSLTNAPNTTADFIELLNPSTNAVDLAGVSLSDDSSFPRKWSFPEGTTLAAHSRLTVLCDASLPASATNTSFALNAEGGAVYLFDKPARGGALLDARTYGLQPPDFSLGRLPDGTGEWTLTRPTPGGVNLGAGLGSVSTLRLNEWMADPANGSDWFEVFNSGDQPVALAGLCLTDNLADPFQAPIPPLSFIGAGPNGHARFFADGGSGAGHVVFSLRKSGEALGLFTRSGVMLDGISFGPQTTGVSQGRFPDGGDAIASFSSTASPGASNYLPLEGLVINEVLTHTDPPFDDAVEFLNLTASPIPVGGWYLSNSESDLRKCRIPDGTILPAGAFLVLYEPQFNGTNAVPFTFNSAHGDSAILSQADAQGNLSGYRAQVAFGAAENRIPFGRILTSTGADFAALDTPTFGHDNPVDLADFHLGIGAPNAVPKIGPVVISEINYLWREAGVEQADAEFIELQNVSPNPVQLQHPDAATNHWRLRDAVSFEFPADVTLASGERILVVGFDPADPVRMAAFVSRFNVPNGTRILGPWNGRLGNSDNSVELVKPDAVQLPPHPDAGYVPQILVDRVHYASTAPWAAAAADGAHSLQRVSPQAYGNDPVNWVAALPTAGRANVTPTLDSDADGLPDAWELEHFHTLARDGSGDFDGDGSTDLEEYAAGTNPQDPTDVLRVTATSASGMTTVEFTGVAGRSYTVQYQDALGGGLWQKLGSVPTVTVTGPVGVPDTKPSAEARFYRVVTPAQP